MENTSQKLVAASYKRNIKKKFIVEFRRVEMFLCSFYVETTTRKIHQLQKPIILSLWFTDLRISVSTFRNVYVNEADHMTKSGLNSELKMAATIMTLFSRGIPLGIGQSRRKWNILNTPIKTWIANLSIGDEEIVVSAVVLTIDPVLSFAVHPVISDSIGSDPRCARNEKAARGSDLNRTIKCVETSCVYRSRCTRSLLV